MGLFSNKRLGTIFMKEDSEAELFIERMKELAERTKDSTIKKEIDKQFR